MKFKVFVFSLIASFVAVNSAHAVVVFEQPYAGDTGGANSQDIEDSFGNIINAFESFTLNVDSSITSVNWHGFGIGGEPAQFDVRFYADDTSAFFAPDLGALIYNEIVTPTVLPPTVDSSTGSTKQYTADLAAPVSFLSGQRYWISIVGLGEAFAWSIANRTGLIASYNYSTSSFTLGQTDLAFALISNTEVPLPAAFPLFLAGISGVVAVSRKRRNKA